MSQIKINPIARLNGEIIASPSKSYSHRAFIAASLADGVSVIKNPLTSGDVKTTIDILRQLGTKIIEKSHDSFIIEKGDHSYKSPENIIDCKNSGTSLRLFSALSLLVKGGLTFTGEFLRRQRPIIQLLESLKSLGAHYVINENSLHVERINIKCDLIKIQGDVSSQFITALLFLSPLIKCENNKGIEIEITSPLISYPYIKITMEVLSSFGINIREKLNEDKMGKYIIAPGQKFRPQIYDIPGDFSSAAFLIGATCMTPKSSQIIIKNLNMKDAQGDKRIIEILQQMGAKIQTLNENEVQVNGNLSKYPLKGTMIDCEDIPDLFPLLCVVGAVANGKTTLYNATNLRRKESDRISIMVRELEKKGVRVKEKQDKLTIFHSELKGSEIDHEGDHRIAMACSIASLFSDSPSTMRNVEVVGDSYPKFFEDLRILGANMTLD
ncbi:MAG: 3-phosphoshikimate 1-carboxyvinyltransferase [Promethearchaeota archaeon]|nr:MAG: 3-phosphoshikimate 1-carboxyvinyltransferase [Candidatus Lokiarchaeota archaeon]